LHQVGTSRHCHGNTVRGSLATDGLTERRADMTKITGAFHDSAKAPKMLLVEPKIHEY